MALLYSRSFGEPGQPPLVILHGLMGSSRNWLAAARDLAAFAHVHLVELRNHGQSFHAEESDYPSMAEDVLEWLTHMGLAQSHVMGHSMGGKLAMYLACHHSERMQSLIVVDNAPRRHKAYFEKEITALAQMDIASHLSRTDLERQLERIVPDWALRKFLLSNLVRNEEEGSWQWQPNVPVLWRSLDLLADNPISPQDRYDGPTLFLMGGDSPFIPEEDRKAIPGHFPHARITNIPGADHNPHFSQRLAFVEEVRQFLG